MYYINIFFIYSLIGFIYEITISFILNNKLESGFLYGPWTPIYGVGVLLILLISRFIFKKFKFIKIIKNIIFYLVIVAVLTIIEYISGNLLYFIYHKDFWNYSKLPLHIGKYISIEISFLWGLFSLIVIYVIHPQIRKITKKVPKPITFVLIILFVIDLIYSLIFSH